MIENLLFWTYLTNSVILIVHEIDSAYWEEWNLFPPLKKDGIKGFLIIHFPFIFAILYGLTIIDQTTIMGIVLSVFLSVCGIFAFFFHFYHLRKGRPEFNNMVSKTILIMALPVSVFQLILTFLII
jgi:Family of unknown function (DUF6713)